MYMQWIWNNDLIKKLFDTLSITAKASRNKDSPSSDWFNACSICELGLLGTTLCTDAKGRLGHPPLLFLTLIWLQSYCDEPAKLITSKGSLYQVVSQSGKKSKHCRWWNDVWHLEGVESSGKTFCLFSVHFSHWNIAVEVFLSRCEWHTSASVWNFNKVSVLHSNGSTVVEIAACSAAFLPILKNQKT